MHKLLFFIAIAISTLVDLRSLAAQSSVTDAQVLALIPPDAVACLTLRPKLLAQDKTMQLGPLEVLTAAGLDSVGIDPLKIERIDALVGTPGPNPSIAIIVNSTESVAASKIDQQLLGEKFEVGGRQFFGIRKLPAMAVTFVNDRQAIVGTPTFIASILSAKQTTGELAQQVDRIAQSGFASLVVVIPPMREILAEVIPAAPPPLQADAKTIIEKTKMVAFKLQPGNDVFLPIVIETTSDADAQLVESSFSRVREVLVPQSLAQLVSAYRMKDGPIKLASDAYVDRLKSEITKQLTPTRDGPRLHFRVDASTLNLIRGATTFSSLMNALPGMRINPGSSPARRT